MGAPTVPARLRIILTTLLTLAAIVATVLLVVWPWPAPEVDWRTPLAAALGKKDCDRVGEIINAATDAGSLEAYDLFAKPGALGPCHDSRRLRLPPDMIATNGQWLRKARSEPRSHSRLGADYNADGLAALGFWMRQYAQTVDFFCLHPYDTEIKVDYAALSEVVPDDAGWLSALHRRRRDLCIGIVNDLAASLAAESESQAKEIASFITTWPPANGSAGASVVTANLVLAQDFILSPATRNDPDLLSTRRRTAWWLLDAAAARGDPSAIDLMIALLRKGRFVEDARSLVERLQPYFWVLRSRRLGLPAQPVHDEIERALSAEDRTRIKAEEESHWLRSQTPRA
jgi:hypothetical protein